MPNRPPDALRLRAYIEERLETLLTEWIGTNEDEKYIRQFAEAVARYLIGRLRQTAEEQITKVADELERELEAR